MRLRGGVDRLQSVAIRRRMLTYADVCVSEAVSIDCSLRIRSERGWNASSPPAGTQFTCFTGTNVRYRYRLQSANPVGARVERQLSTCRYSVYLLYWYKRTLSISTAVCESGRSAGGMSALHLQVLSLLALLVQTYAIDIDCSLRIRSERGWNVSSPPAGTQFTCFTGTNVRYRYRLQSANPVGARVERQLSTCRYSVYWLYWYKRTNTDTQARHSGSKPPLKQEALSY
jgi:hypothetical protein